MPTKRQFSDIPGVFRASSEGNTANLLIYDEIGDDPDFFPVNPTDFAVAIENLRGADEVVLRINSPGGNVFAGVAMYNSFRQFKGKKTVQIDGLCASIASVLAMGADEIKMADTAMLMIHNPRLFGIFGDDAAGFRATADLLDQVAEATMIPAYKRSGKPEDEIRAIMAKTVYYSAEEAKAECWIDTLLDLPKPQRLAAHVSFSLKAFADAPKGIAQAVDGCVCPCGSCSEGNCADCATEDCGYDGCTCEQSHTSAKSRRTAAAASASQHEAGRIATRVRDRILRLAELD